MAKIVCSLNMEERVWKRIEEQAVLMKRSRSELCEQWFAEAFGITDLVPKPTMPKPKGIK